MKNVMRQYLTLLIVSCTWWAPAHADTKLTMRTDIPEVKIESGDVRRDFVRLPALRFAFTFHASCSAGLLPASLQLSVADTRKTLRGDEIATENSTSVALSIPANQIAPVVIKEFCAHPDTEETATGAGGKQSRVIIPATLSAQASLRCANESSEQTVYVSGPLDVALTCETPSESAAER